MVYTRDVNGVKEFLNQFKNIKYITRDGSIMYRKAIDESHPNAIQISDRFHLLKGMTTALQKDIIKNFPYIIIDETIAITTKVRKNNKEITEKEILIKEILKTYSKTKNISKTSKIHNIDRKTIKNYIDGMYNINIKRNRITFLRNHEKDIRKYYNKGMKKTDILKELITLGYKGSRSNLSTYINKYISEDKSILSKTQIKRQKLINLLYNKGISEIGLDDDDKLLLIKYLKTNELANLILKIALEFRIALFSKKPVFLISWLDKYRNLKELKHLNSFINGIYRDIEAALNSIIYDESNGVTEGIVNKIKNKKRVMYGRCNFETLRAYFFNAKSTH